MRSPTDLEKRFLAHIAEAKSFKAKRIAEIDAMANNQRRELARLEAVSQYWGALSPAAVREIMAEENAEKARDKERERKDNWHLQEKKNNEQDAQRERNAEPLYRIMWAVFGFMLGVTSFWR